MRAFSTRQQAAQGRATSVTGLLLAIVILAFGLNGMLRDSVSADNGMEVDLLLVLATDCSYSVDEQEYRLQMEGIAHAFASSEIHDAIADGPLGRIAVIIMQWTDENNQQLVTPWRVIDGRESALAFAAEAETLPRVVGEGATGIGAALQYAARTIENAPFTALRKVIDLSGDGRNNRGPRPEDVRDAIADRGITINGLAIIDEWPTLDIYFRRSVVAGPHHFVVVANDYEAYAEAIHRKLLMEIKGPGIS